MLIADKSFLEANSWLPGVVVAIVLFLIGTSITLYLRNRDKASKTLDYREHGDNMLFNTSAAKYASQLKVLVDEQPVEKPRIATVVLRNTGGTVIEQEDFIKVPLVETGTAVFKSVLEIKDRHNILDHLKLTGTSSSYKVEAVLGVMNPGDEVAFTLLLDGAGEISCSSRIKGQTRETEVFPAEIDRATKTASRVSAIAGLIIFVATLITLLVIGGSAAAPYVVIESALLGLAAWLVLHMLLNDDKDLPPGSMARKDR